MRHFLLIIAFVSLGFASSFQLKGDLNINDKAYYFSPTLSYNKGYFFKPELYNKVRNVNKRRNFLILSLGYQTQEKYDFGLSYLSYTDFKAISLFGGKEYRYDNYGFLLHLAYAPIALSYKNAASYGEIKTELSKKLKENFSYYLGYRYIVHFYEEHRHQFQDSLYVGITYTFDFKQTDKNRQKEQKKRQPVSKQYEPDFFILREY